MGKLLDWLDHRTGYRKLRDALLLEHIPGGARWRYVWGSTLAFVFMIQVVTGVLLMTAYAPSDKDAWLSVHFIQYQMDFGWLIRGLHHFGSQTMVVLIGVHMLQVVIAGAHLPPREVNWWLGLALMGLVLGLSLTGYLLPWDQKGFYATQVATNIIGKLPLIGPFVQKVLIGGPEYGNLTLTHFFALHVGILPPLVVLLIIMHLAAFRRHGVTAPKMPEPAGEAMPHPAAAPQVLRAVLDLVLGLGLGGIVWYFGVPPATCLLIAGLFVVFAVSRFFYVPKQIGHFWPDQAFRDLLVCLFIFAIMLSLVVFSDHGHKIDMPADPEAGMIERWAKAGQEGRGANLDAPADRITESYEARPEWYFLFLFQLLKYFPGDQEFIGTVVIPGLVGLVLFLLPLMGYGRMRRFGHLLGIVVVSVLLAAASFLTVLAIADDSAESMVFGWLGGSDKAKAYQKGRKKSEEEARISVQAAVPGGPAEGARYVVRSNPLIAGKKLFKLHCASCHAYEFKEPEEEKKADKAVQKKASDLTDYASEPWILGLLQAPEDEKYFGHTRLKGMVGWRARLDKSRKRKAPDEIKEEDKELAAIAWWVAQQKYDEDAIKEKKKDKDYLARWQAGASSFEGTCASCHNAGDVKGGTEGPDLTGYGSADWIHLMVLAPTHRARYGDVVRESEKTDEKTGMKMEERTVRNEMPAFRPPVDTPAGKVARDEFATLYKEFPKDKIVDLTDYERELIVRFLLRDDRVVFGALPIAGPVKAKK